MRIRFAPKKSDDELTTFEKLMKFRISVVNRSTFLKWVQATSTRRYQRSLQASLEDDLYYSPRPNPNIYNAAWEKFEYSMLDIERMLARRGIRFHIMLVPESFRISNAEIDNDFLVDTSTIYEWPDDKVKRIAARLEIPVFDVGDALRNYREAHPDERLYFPNDNNHPNMLGHSIIARPVEAYLRELIDESQVSAQARLGS